MLLLTGDTSRRPYTARTLLHVSGAHRTNRQLKETIHV